MRPHRVHGETVGVERVDELVGAGRHLGEDPEPGVRVDALAHGTHRLRDRLPAHAVEAVAAGDVVRLDHLRVAVCVDERDARVISVGVEDRGVGHLPEELLAVGLADPDEVLGDLGLAVDPDRVAARLDEVDAPALAGPLEVDAVVPHPLAVQAIGSAVLGEDVDGAVLDDAGADPGKDVVLRTVLHHDRVDAVLGEDLGEQQARGTGTDDGNLSTHGGHAGALDVRWEEAASVGRKSVRLSCAA